MKGGQIFGEYPDDLTSAGAQIIEDVGITIPSTPWEALWNGVAEWFGITRLVLRNDEFTTRSLKQVKFSHYLCCFIVIQ